MKPRRGEVSIALQPHEPGGDTTPEQRPQDYFAWSFFNVLLGHLAYLGCLCLPALLLSIRARDCNLLGDLEGARRHGLRAKVLNIICTVLMVVAVVSVVVLAIILVTSSR
ncbi:dispanin subfamily A member 2b-like [Cuculus canorus]|uniref:dispanin subfamily A member 2b-like n=1 Tax=Cuculus canorus TaxID=55661 RepID=UPI0023AB41D5|nr:dispanin subfamily A member 2b-like [Cuculus canorus]